MVGYMGLVGRSVVAPALCALLVQVYTRAGTMCLERKLVPM